MRLQTRMVNRAESTGDPGIVDRQKVRGFHQTRRKALADPLPATDGHAEEDRQSQVYALS